VKFGGESGPLPWAWLGWLALGMLVLSIFAHISADCGSLLKVKTADTTHNSAKPLLGCERRAGRVVIEGGGGADGATVTNARTGQTKAYPNYQATRQLSTRAQPMAAEAKHRESYLDKKLRNQRGFVEGDAKTLAPDPGSLELPDRFRE